MLGRRANNQNYRYGFNGKEKDDSGEWGSNTNYDYGFRIYNPSIAKFLSVDPLTKDYPWYTPYQFAGNTPIAAIDLDGAEPQWVVQYFVNAGINAFGEAAITFMFNPKVKSWGSAFKVVNYKNVLAESVVDLASSKKVRMAGHGVYNMIKYVNQVGPSNVTTTGLLTSGGIGALQPIIGDAVGHYGWKATKWGLRKIGLDWKTIKQLQSDLSVRAGSTSYLKIPVDGNDLGQRAINLRNKLGNGANKFARENGGKKAITTSNVAIAEVSGPNGNYYIEAVSQGGIENHAERLILRKLQDLGIDFGDVKRLYTEIEPCKSCKDNATDLLENADIFYSFKFKKGNPEHKKYVRENFK